MTTLRRIKSSEWPTLAGLIARLEQLPAIKAQAESAASADIRDGAALVLAVEQAPSAISAKSAGR